MFAWWWLVIMFLIGAAVGAAVVFVCMQNDADLTNARGWNDE